MMGESRHFVVTGHVQGVSFRDWTVDAATRIGVTGWVRNRTDGSFETIANGSPEALAAFEAALREGPPSARVETVEATASEETPTGGFERRHDA